MFSSANQQLNPEDEQYKQQNEYLLAKIARLKLASIPTFDCIFLGDSGVGKKSFLERHKIGVINKKDNMYPIEFFTNRGAIRFRVLNACTYLIAKKKTEIIYKNRINIHILILVSFTAHLQQYEDICSYYKYVKCAIIMFDVSRAETFNNVSHWLNRFTKPTPDFPIVLCGNKADIRPHNVGTKDIVAIERSDNLPVSCLSDQNVM